MSLDLINQRIQQVCYYIQMAQKKKKNPQMVRKLKHVKSQQGLPLGTLMHQIGELRQQLRGLKNRKTTELPAQSRIQKQNKETEKIVAQKTQKIVIQRVICFKPQHEVKMELICNKINKSFSQISAPAQLQNHLNIFVERINDQSRQMISQIERLTKQIIQMQAQRAESDQKYAIVKKNNSKLERQVQELYKNVMQLAAKQNSVQNNKIRDHQQLQLTLAEMKIELQQTIKNNVQLQSIAQQWQLQGRSLQQKCITLQRALASSHQQSCLLKQDIKLMRAQCDKTKIQKKQIQKLWQRANKQHEDQMRKLGAQFSKIENQKSRWMNECQLRRQQSSQIQAVQNHKTMLFKEIQELRNNYSLKCKELSDCKTMLHETQRQLIASQGEGYKITQQLQKLKRQKQYWSNQVEGLKGQVQQWQGVRQKRSQILKKKQEILNNGKQVRQQKLKALQDIHSLIRQHRQQLDESP